jgi:nicotinate dehydrogenase subunit B
VLGDTSLVPNQGATIASETIQITAVPLAQGRGAGAAVSGRACRGAAELPVEDLVIEDGLIRGKDNRSVSYGELIAGETIQLELAG